MGSLLQHHAVNAFIARIENSYREVVALPRANRLGGIENKGCVRPLVCSEMLSVQPNLGNVIDLVEAQQGSAASVGVCGWFELAPVPHHAVVSGKNLLNDGGHARTFRIRGRR